MYINVYEDIKCESGHTSIWLASGCGNYSLSECESRQCNQSLAMLWHVCIVT